MAKDLVNRAASSDLVTALNLEAFAQSHAIVSDDHREGVTAFFDKRRPTFHGR